MAKMIIDIDDLVKEGVDNHTILELNTVGHREIFDAIRNGFVLPDNNNIRNRTMTRKEAIEELKLTIGLIKQNGKDWLDERDIPVLQMAIASLETDEAYQLEYERTTEEKYCDRNICASNDVNGIGCEDCEVTKSLECKVEDKPSLDDFIEYAKKTFGVELRAVKSDNPDTFEKLFGECKTVDCISREYLKQSMIEYGWKHPDSTVAEYVDSLPSVYPESDKPLSFKEMMDRLNLTTDDIEKAEDLDFEIESLMPSYSNLLKANNQLKKQIEMLKLYRDCEKHSVRWIPVSERLPNDRDWYLGIFKESDTGWVNPLPFVCDYVGRETKATTKEFWILRGFTDIDNPIDYYLNLECVAWMPLPEPYQMESEDNKWNDNN